MKLLKNILLAVEDSQASARMLKVLLNLPGSRGARITALHVVRNASSSDKQAEALARGRELLEKTTAMLALGPEYEYRTVLRSGDPKDIVSSVAEEIDASLLLMGSRGLNNLVAILKNSVSQYVFQRASCPMMLLREGVYVNRLNRIAVAVSDTMASKTALKTAADLVKQIPGGQLFLIRIRTRPLGSKEIDKIVNPEEESLILATAAEFVRQQGVPYKAFYAAGKPGVEICRIATENNADLLVIGCEDRRPTIAMNLPDLDRLLGASVSDYVRVHASCPVLLQKVST
ncbi:MAG: universal stress protein [Gloeobacterales cyanobacterium]